MKTMYKKYLLLLLLVPLNLLAQSKLQGVVVDKSINQPLPGVNIVVEGTTNGVSTNLDGSFLISNLRNGDRLKFSFLGYAEQTVTYVGQNNIEVSMQEITNKLNDVVVIGYGSVKKKDATGSVDLITAKEFNKGPVLSVDQLLIGKAPGLRITTDGGKPDAAPNIRIRGGSSLSAQNNPLIVIDGVPLDLVNAAGNSNPLSLVNPNDIESFSILKDASATAIYGSRASNGVIIITTKKGSSGKPEFTFSSSVSVGSVRNTINMMNGPEFANFVRANFSDADINRLGVDDPNDPNDNYHDDPATPQIEGRILYNTDWQKAIYRNSLLVDNNFSARANLFKKVPFRASVGYTKNEGLVRTNDLDRYTTSLKLTPTLFDNHLKIDINAKGLSSKKNAIDEGGAIGGALAMDPTKPIYGNTPSGYYYETISTGISGATNPVAILEQRRRPESILKFLGNIELDYKLHFLPEMRAVLNLGAEASKSNIREYFGENALQTFRVPNGNLNNAVFNPGENFSERQTITNKTMDAYLVYAKELKGFLNKFDVQGGYSYQNFKNDGNKTNYFYDNNGLRKENIDPNNRYNRYFDLMNIQSFFGRANIDFANKYLFTVSFRTDGSSLFRENKRWGQFPSAAFAWKVTDESFAKDSKIINNLKVRLGWGKTGQQDITSTVNSYYPTDPLFIINNNNSQYFPGYSSYSAKPFDPNVTWEKTTTYNAGIDFGVFEDIVSGSVDVYQKETTDLLAKVQTGPGQALTNEFVSNVGSTKGRGAEASLIIKAIKSDNFNVDFNANGAFNYTKVTDLKGKAFVAIDNSLPTGTGVKIQRHVVGYQPDSFWVLEQIYDGNGNPIEGAFVDRDGDNKITDADRVYKASRPNWTFGFGTSVNYKNIDLTASFRGQVGGLVYDAREMVSGNINQALPVNSNALSNVLQNPRFTDNNDPIFLSDYFLEDASFLRCENITLGYSVKNAVKNGSLRLYVAANNLFIVTKYTGQDPENFNSIDNNLYPRPQVYSFGMNLNF